MKVNAVIPAHLHLVCRRCTREAGFAGTREEAEALAKREGWIIEESRYWTTAVCPKCPGTRPAHLPTPAETYAAAMIGNVEPAL